MTAGAVLFGVAGLLAAAGLVAVIAGCAGSSWPALRLPRRLRGWRVNRVHLAAVAVGLITLLVTGWPVAAIGVGLAVGFAPSVLGGTRAAERQIARTEAIAAWTRRLADLLASGAAGSLDAALRRSAATCPAPIAAEVAALAARIGPQGLEPALRAFAADLDDPAAERVAAALILRARHGGRGLAAVLSGLAADVGEQVRMTREVEAERAKPRANTRTVVILTGLLVAAMLVFARGFLAPYGTPVGEVALASVVLVFAIALRWMRSMAAPVRPPALLINPPGERS